MTQELITMISTAVAGATVPTLYSIFKHFRKLRKEDAAYFENIDNSLIAYEKRLKKLEKKCGLEEEKENV